ncbi:MAG TPA: FHA domain-containing protein [Acidimicrobiales bacterium]
MSDSLLTLLKLGVVALLYLFFFRVLRAVWVEVSGATPAPAGTRPGGGRRSTPSRRSATRSAGTGRARGNVKGEPALVFVAPEHRSGETTNLTEEITIGRTAGCGITLDDGYVSNMHARLFRRDSAIYVEDLGSTNGTYVNRKRVTAPTILRRGDRLQVGDTVMELR